MSNSNNMSINSCNSSNSLNMNINKLNKLINAAELDKLIDLLNKYSTYVSGAKQKANKNIKDLYHPKNKQKELGRIILYLSVLKRLAKQLNSQGQYKEANKILNQIRNISGF